LLFKTNGYVIPMILFADECKITRRKYLLNFANRQILGVWSGLVAFTRLELERLGKECIHQNQFHAAPTESTAPQLGKAPLISGHDCRYVGQHS
jgi:hypothetical protein